MNSAHFERPAVANFYTGPHRASPPSLKQRQEHIRQSWSESERIRRRELAARQQLRLLRLLGGQTELQCDSALCQ